MTLRSLLITCIILLISIDNVFANKYCILEKNDSCINIHSKNLSYNKEKKLYIFSGDATLKINQTEIKADEIILDNYNQTFKAISLYNPVNFYYSNLNRKIKGTSKIILYDKANNQILLTGDVELIYTNKENLKNIIKGEKITYNMKKNNFTQILNTVVLEHCK